MKNDRFEGNEGKEFARKYLVQVVVDDVNWIVLHRNPKTAEYWKEFFLSRELTVAVHRFSSRYPKSKPDENLNFKGEGVMTKEVIGGARSPSVLRTRPAVAFHLKSDH